MTQLLVFIIVVSAPFVLYGCYLLWMRSANMQQRRARPARDANPQPQLRRSEPALTAASAQQHAAGAPPADLALEPELSEAPVPRAAEDESGQQAQAEPAPQPPASEELERQPEPERQAAAVGEAEQESALGAEFPPIGASQLNEFFYYAVRVRVDKPMPASSVRHLARKLSSSAELQMYQLMLGHDPKAGAWESMRPDKAYRHLIWAVPLCNRKTRLDGALLGKIVTIFQDAMRANSGKAEFASHADVQQRLEKVNEFCDEVDHKVKVHLVANREDQGTPRRCGDILALALSEKIEEIDGSLVRMANGEAWFRLYAGSGEELVSKSPDRMIASLILEMDFPHVSNTEAALNEMFELAAKLARVLRFRLVDADHQPIDEQQIDQIHQDIQGFGDFMRDHGVRPGSKLARALFS